MGYRLGKDWGEKKAICNKFHCSVSISSLHWPLHSEDAVYYGGLDGSIRMGDLSSNTHQQLHVHAQSMLVVAIDHSGDDLMVITDVCLQCHPHPGGVPGWVCLERTSEKRRCLCFSSDYQASSHSCCCRMWEKHAHCRYQQQRTKTDAMYDG